jgi:hypothetical protein
MKSDMDSLFDTISKKMFGSTWDDPRREVPCVRCGGEALSFKDENASDIYDVMGYCQSCQNLLESGGEDGSEPTGVSF